MKSIRANLSIKLLSLLIAVILWAAIMNHINPVVNGYVNLPVDTINESYLVEQNKAYTILDSKYVKINYKVKTNNMANIRQSDFRVYIDLFDLEHTNDLTVRYEILNGIDDYITSVRVEPQKLHVVIDEAERNEYSVKYSIKGNVGPGHSVGNVILSPNVIYVTGSNTKVGSIDHISIDIPVKDNEEMFSGVTKPIVYDKSGNIINGDDITLSAEEVSYSVVVYSRGQITLNPVVTGNVSQGYTYAGAQVYPNSIMVDGQSSVVRDLYVVDLPTINIDGFTGNREFTYKVSDILPVGVKSNVETVKVNITINDNVLNRPEVLDVGPHNASSETPGSSNEETDSEEGTEDSNN